VGFDAGRLRKGELVAGGGAVLMLADVFMLPWFGAPASRPGSLDGWHALTDIRWILLLTIAVSLALVYCMAARRSPAIPITLSIFTSVLGGLSSLLLVYSLIDQPGAARLGMYAGLIDAVVIAYGGYLSMRAEGSPFGDPASIETVHAPRTRAGPDGRTEPDSAEWTGPGTAGRSGVDSGART